MSTTAGYTSTHLDRVCILLHLSHNIYFFRNLTENAEWSDLQRKLHSKSALRYMRTASTRNFCSPLKKICNLSGFFLFATLHSCCEKKPACVCSVALVHFSLINIKLTERLTLCLNAAFSLHYEPFAWSFNLEWERTPSLLRSHSMPCSLCNANIPWLRDARDTSVYVLNF